MKSIPHPPSPSPQSAQASALRANARFSELSAPWQALVRLCQAINYGFIEGLRFSSAEPIFGTPPVVLVDVKLDADEVPRPEAGLTDFELCDGVRRLIGEIHRFKAGVIERIEIRAGIPRRVVFRGSPAGVPFALPDSGHPNLPLIDGLGDQTDGVADHER
jgi:hypothetical protein